MTRGGVCKEVIESHPKILRHDVSDKSINITKTSRANEKHTMPSTNVVYELLECPMCTKLMYPPIHQVCYIYIFLLLDLLKIKKKMLTF